VFYTPAARAGAGGQSQIETQISNAIANANVACSASAVDIEYRLVRVAETNYVETGTSTDLSRFRSTNDGFMDEVHAQRASHGGDLMALVINQSSSFCGVGYLMTSQSAGFRTSAFSVTVRTCISGQTLTHEMGHTQGCHHDRANAGGGGLYAYSYGWRTPDNAYRTIMAYAPGARINVWSSPNVIHNSQTMGTPNDDNARSLNNARVWVEQFAPMTTLVWTELTGGISGTFGRPTLRGAGTKNLVVPITITLGGMRNGAAGALIAGASELNLPILGGTLVPSPDLAVALVGNGSTVTLPADGLAALPGGTDLWLQCFWADPTAVQGVAATNGVKCRVP
jgi:hypothetical protein